MPEIETTVGGLRAIELKFRPMRDIASGRTLCFLSRTQLNTPGLGTLMPESFRAAAEASGQSKKLFPLELLQLGETLSALVQSERAFDWVSLDMPMRILNDRASVTIIEKVCEQFSLTPGKFCFALPEQVLSAKEDSAEKNIARLRRHGYHMMVSGFGESGCPFIKLSELPVDYVMLSPSVTRYIGKSERSDQAVHSIISFVNELGCEPIADGVQNSTQANSLYSFGCNYCAGPLSGDYLTVDDLTN